MEQNLKPLNAAEAFAACEGLWRDADARSQARRLFDAAYASFNACVMVLDDDPTGVQTVHDVTIVTNWTVETLYRQFASGEKLFFVLTNSAAFPLGRRRRRTGKSRKTPVKRRRWRA